MEKINIIIFGASGAGVSFISYVNSNDTKYNIIAIADNDKRKHGIILNGNLIISPEEINRFDYDEIIITSSFFPEIIEQLKNDLNISPTKIKLAPKSMTGNKKSYRPFSDKKTLELARKTFLFISKILEEENIKYFTDHGTLLGIVRDGDLIPWDDDIDLSIEEKYMNIVINRIKMCIHEMPNYELLNWKITVYYKDENIPVKLLLSFDENHHNYKLFPLSIETFRFEKGQAIQELSYSEEYHFKKNQYINYYGQNISVPFDYERYLESHYGNWKITKKDTTFLDAKNYKMPSMTYKREII